MSGPDSGVSVPDSVSYFLLLVANRSRSGWVGGPSFISNTANMNKLSCSSLIREVITRDSHTGPHILE